MPTPVINEDGTIDIISVDQWTATGNITEVPFDELTSDCIEGGDSQAARVLFGGHFKRGVATQNHLPSRGSVFLAKDVVSGKAFIWKSNYDTSG